VAGFYASSSTSAVASRRRCYSKLLGEWGMQPHPVTLVTVVRLAAALKAGRYRSAPSVLSQLKVDALRLGQDLSLPILKSLSDGSRACRRGMGPPRGALALDFFALGGLPPDPAPLALHGPLAPRNALVVSAWWLLREVETANLRARHVSLKLGAIPWVEILLPTSKSDVEALGVARAHACCCGQGPYRPDCPVHSCWDHLLLLKRRFPHRFSGGVAHEDMPFFPDVGGKTITKAGFTETVRAAARILRLPEVASDGVNRLSGHSMRVSGAQGLSKLGVDTYAVQLLGRWGSSTVERYVREAAVGEHAARARGLMITRSLDDLVGAARADHLHLKSEALDKARVQEWLEAWAPQFARSLRTSLVEEVAAHLRATAARTLVTSSSSSSSSSSSTSSVRPAAPEPGPELETEPEVGMIVGPPLFDSQVSNSKTRVSHVIEVGPPTLDHLTWVTKCGWRFGRHGRATRPVPEFTKCRHCFP